MRTALITDIHANREAFTACLKHALQSGANHYALLGDFVGYGADPAWVIEEVMALAAQGAITLMGNHDASIAGLLRNEMNADAQAVIQWTQAQLQPHHLHFLKQLPLTQSQADMLYVHANAWDPEGYAYISDGMSAMRSLQATQAAITFCGHMHDPMLYHLGKDQRIAAFLPIPGQAIPLSPHRRWLVIPGACGQPRDGNPAACYALFDHGTRQLTYYRVPYDYHQTITKIRQAGLPIDTTQRLSSRLSGDD